MSPLVEPLPRAVACVCVRGVGESVQRRVHVWGGGGGKGEGAQGEGKRGTEAGHPGREAKGGGEGGARGRAHLTGTPPFPSLRPRPLPLSLSPSSLHPPPPLRPPRAPPSSPPRPSPHAHTHTPHPHPPTHTHAASQSRTRRKKRQRPFFLPSFFLPSSVLSRLPFSFHQRHSGQRGARAGRRRRGVGGREREREGRKPLPPFLASPFFPSPTRIRHTPSTYRAPRGLAGRRGRGEGGEREEEREGERGFPLSPSFPTRSPFAPPPFRTRLAPFLPPLSLRNLLLHPLQAVGSGALPSFLPSTHTRADRPPQTQIQSTGPPAGATRRPL